MPDTVTSQTILDGQRMLIMKFTSSSDGTGESAVKKVDVSALNPYKVTGAACTGVVINKVKYDCSGMQVAMLWDATADVPALVLQGYGEHDFTDSGGVTNNSGTGKNGDLLFTTDGQATGSSYSIYMVMKKVY